MPGVYYTVESNAGKHLAAQLGQAVKKALSLPAAERRAMFEQALARRFPVGEMMDA